MSKILLCKTCGKKLLSYEPYNRKYNHPFRECKKCGTKYLDPRYHELAIEGIPQSEFSIRSNLILILLGGLIVWRGQYLFGVHQLGFPDEMQWFLPTVFLLLGCALILGGTLEIIFIKSGKKAAKYQAFYEASCMRMKDSSYVNTLQGLGYPVPEQFLAENHL